MIRRLLFLAGVVGLGASLTSCASTTPSSVSSTIGDDRGPALLCNLHSLRWNHGFIARADTRDCIAILESVQIGN